MVSSKVLKALYVINKNAKQFATQARQSYKTRNHAGADMNSNRKEALYSLKAQVLLQLYPQSDRIEKHTIDGSEYYHFEFEDGENTWKFHLPTSKISVSSSEIQSEDTLTNFSKDSRVEGVNMTLKTALQVMNDELGINANRHLPHSDTNSKWPFLY